MRARRGAIAALMVGAMVLTGCTRPRTDATPIKLSSAFVMQMTGFATADGYLIIQNSGPADRLMNVRANAGGSVLLRSPVGAGSALTIGELTIPGHTSFRLSPAGTHLELTHLALLPAGSEVTLTLVFAHAGAVRVVAQVTNPQTPNNTYFGP